MYDKRRFIGIIYVYLYYKAAEHVTYVYKGMKVVCLDSMQAN
jgi:hypothetical protein